MFFHKQKSATKILVTSKAKIEAKGGKEKSIKIFYSQLQTSLVSIKIAVTDLLSARFGFVFKNFHKIL